MSVQRLKQFVQDMTRLADAHHGNEAAMLGNGRLLLAGLVAQDDWLPAAFARVNPERYTQYLCIAIRWSGSRWSASSGGPAR